MSTFDCLIIAHIIGDWLFQTEFQAITKSRGNFFNKGLVTHCSVYTLMFIPAFFISEIHMSWLLLIFGSHMFIDRRWPVKWWLRHVGRTSEKMIEKTWWLVIAVDQAMHVAIIAIVIAGTAMFV